MERQRKRTVRSWHDAKILLTLINHMYKQRPRGIIADTQVKMNPNLIVLAP